MSDGLFKPYVPRLPALGFVRCKNGDNPIPGTSGWHITTGKDYLVTKITPSGDWLIVLADDGKQGSYHRSRFERIEP